MYVNFGLAKYTISNSKRRPRMNILSWILVGLVAGIIAKLLMPGRDPGGASSLFSSESPVPFLGAS